MMKDQVKVESVKEEVTRMSKRLRIALLCPFAALLALGGMLVFSLAGGGGPIERPYSQTAFNTIASLVLAAIGVAILLLIIKIFKDSVHSASPFSAAQSRRMVIVGVLLVAFALVGTGAVAFMSVSSGLEPATSSRVIDIQLAVIHIDILFIVAAIVSFYLSYIFKYGTFLQWLYDETV